MLNRPPLGLGGGMLLVALAVKATFGVFLLATVVATELIAPIERFTLRQRIPGALMAVVGGLLGAALVWPLNQLWKWLEIAPWITIPLWEVIEPLGTTAYVLQFLVLVVVADFLAYWRHRAEHSKWLWPVHAVHHAPTELHAANSIGHPLQALFSMAFIVIPMSLFDLSGPGVPLAVAMFVQLLALYIHSPTEIHFGKAARVVVDNRFHRIHHSLEPRHFDRNFGICLSCWDYMFGTAYTPEPGEWPVVGLEHVPAPQTVSGFLAMPFPQYRRLVLGNAPDQNVGKVVWNTRDP